MLELVDEYKEPFARQRTMNRTIFNLQEHNMLCTVVGWTAQHADEAWLPHTKIPQEYRLACRGKSAVVTLNMEQIHDMYYSKVPQMSGPSLQVPGPWAYDGFKPWVRGGWEYAVR